SRRTEMDEMISINMKLAKRARDPLLAGLSGSPLPDPLPLAGEGTIALSPFGRELERGLAANPGGDTPCGCAHAVGEG
ncbi:MAG: hypothetical protein C3F18_01155, partial [Nitrosomonadales bacterium]